RHPVDLLVELDHPVSESAHRHEPGTHAAVDEGRATAPAVWVGVVIGLVAQQHGPLTDRTAWGASPLPRIRGRRWRDLLACRRGQRRCGLPRGGFEVVDD